MTRLSVIIPVYNVELYLSRCLESVCNQTLSDIEIICVNDCSPDNSVKILNEYQKKDKRIIIINHDKNRGLSAARNTGLRHATSDYIYFLDSDDWIALDFLEKMYVVITTQNQKAVCCTNIFSVTADGYYSKLLKRDFTKGIYPFYKACQMAWSWLLRKDFLCQFAMIFPEGLRYEDMYFFYVVIRSLERVYITNETAYYHFENKNSIMGQNKNRTITDFDIIKLIELIYKTYEKEDKLSQWSIPFFYMSQYMLSIHQDKNSFYKQLRNLFLQLADSVNEFSYLYSMMELDFFYDVLNNESYQCEKKDRFVLLDKMRDKIRKQKGE